MSEMIRCDKCKKLMYTDSRSNKGAYCKIGINYTDGYTSLHLCKSCYKQFCTEFIKDYTAKEFDQYFGAESEGDGYGIWQ